GGVCPLAQWCPSRGRRFEPLRRQGRFEGSFRQRRAATLRLVAEAPKLLAELDREAVESLERDGLVTVGGGSAALPHQGHGLGCQALAPGGQAQAVGRR